MWELELSDEDKERTAPKEADPQVYEVFEVLRIIDLIRGDPHPNPIPEPRTPGSSTTLSDSSDAPPVQG